MPSVYTLRHRKGQLTTQSFAEERQFGRTVGLILLAAGSWYAYRGKYATAVPFLVGCGATLVVLGVAWPRGLVTLNRGWMRLAEAMAFVSTRVILGVVFLLVVTPLGIIMRARGWDPLQRRKGHQGSYWAPYSIRQHDPKHFEKMY